MSNGPLDKLVANKTALAAVGLGGGFVALCSGFLGMALVAAGVLKSEPSFADGGPGSTAPSTARDTSPRNPSGDLSNPEAVLNRFLTYLQNDESGKAWDLTSPEFGESKTEFINRMKQQRALVHHAKARWNFQKDDNVMTYHITISGPNGNGSYDLELANKDGSWHVTSFSSH